LVEHGVGFDSQSAKNESVMIQPEARCFVRKAKPPAGCPTGGFELLFGYRSFKSEPVSA
jgi:hypothetical protein